MTNEEKEKLLNQIRHDFIKICIVFRSCKTYKQLLNASKMKNLFLQKYEAIDGYEVGKRYKHLSTLWDKNGMKYLIKKIEL